MSFTDAVNNRIFYDRVLHAYNICLNLGMGILLKNISVHGIFLDTLLEEGNREWQEVSALLSQGMKSGTVRPLDYTVFDKKGLEAAFRYMAQGKHIGKVLIKVSFIFAVHVRYFLLVAHHFFLKINCKFEYFNPRRDGYGNCRIAKHSVCQAFAERLLVNLTVTAAPIYIKISPGECTRYIQLCLFFLLNF